MTEETSETVGILKTKKENNNFLSSRRLSWNTKNLQELDKFQQESVNKKIPTIKETENDNQQETLPPKDLEKHKKELHNQFIEKRHQYQRRHKTIKIQSPTKSFKQIEEEEEKEGEKEEEKQGEKEEEKEEENLEKQKKKKRRRRKTKQVKRIKYTKWTNF